MYNNHFTSERSTKKPVSVLGSLPTVYCFKFAVLLLDIICTLKQQQWLCLGAYGFLGSVLHIMILCPHLCKVQALMFSASFGCCPVPCVYKQLCIWPGLVRNLVSDWSTWKAVLRCAECTALWWQWRTAALPFNLQIIPAIKDDYREIYTVPVVKLSLWPSWDSFWTNFIALLMWFFN